MITDYGRTFRKIAQDSLPEVNERAKNPISLNSESTDDDILRLAIIAELDAINLYEQLAEITSNEKIKEVLLDVAKEEKTHVGEFQALLLKEDPEQENELAAGRMEVEEEIL